MWHVHVCVCVCVCVCVRACVCVCAAPTTHAPGRAIGRGRSLTVETTAGALSCVAKTRGEMRAFSLTRLGSAAASSSRRIGHNSALTRRCASASLFQPTELSRSTARLAARLLMPCIAHSSAVHPSECCRRQAVGTHVSLVRVDRVVDGQRGAGRDARTLREEAVRMARDVCTRARVHACIRFAHAARHRRDAGDSSHLLQVDLCRTIEQQIDHVAVAAVRGVHQDRAAIVIDGRVDVGAEAEPRLDRVDVMHRGVIQPGDRSRQMNVLRGRSAGVERAATRRARRRRRGRGRRRRWRGRGG